MPMIDSINNKIQPGNYWVIHNDKVTNVDLIELNGSPYSSYMYSKKLSCVFYATDIYVSESAAASSHNFKISKEIERMEKYISERKLAMVPVDV